MDEEELRRLLGESVRQFQSRPPYSAFDIATLNSISDSDIEFAIFEYAASALDRTEGQLYQSFLSLPEGIQALYSTWLVDAEVANGGFNQYFWNTPSELVTEAIAGFTFFGATQRAELMREAIAIARAEETEQLKFKQANTLEAFSESYAHTMLAPLDSRYYDISEDLSALRIRAIRDQPLQFVTPSGPTQ